MGKLERSVPANSPTVRRKAVISTELRSALPRDTSGRPLKQGLYDPDFEHDACGVGFVVNIKGHKSHRILEQAIQILMNLDHRGACGCGANTGDGAGILMQMPHGFNEDVCRKARIPLPAPGEYGSGMIFLPRNPSERRKVEETLRTDRAIRRPAGPRLAHVPTISAMLGETARRASRSCARSSSAATPSSPTSWRSSASST